MSATGLSVFDTTVQKSNLWLKELMEELGWDQKQKAYDALRAVLHALRDRLTIEEVAQLGAQLPMLIRGIYYEGWHPTRKPERMRHKDEFLARIQKAFKPDDLIDPEAVARAVFTVLEKRVSEGEIEDVESVLSTELKELWPVSPRV
ncbi:MAG TPA: DUF2267 domain-containing protein [Verrucomicrobiae bacterium]|nr:DUF2267 domain-containing protein [Verrucomicrobiae bacterium]